MESFDQFIYIEGDQNSDLRNSNFKMQNFDNRLSQLKFEQKKVCIKICIFFEMENNFYPAHEVFAQLDQDYYRLCCTESGLYEYPDFNEWHRGFNRYLNGLSRPVKKIEIYFYTPITDKTSKDN